MIYGVDISNYQAELTDFSGLQRDGFDFAFILSSDGTDFKNIHFGRQVAGCLEANQLVAAYHYVRDASISDQIRNIRQQVPIGMPVIPDSEVGSGGVQVLRALVDALIAEGYKVPLTYLPRWYWKDYIGSPALHGLSPLWISWYPDYETRSKEAGAAQLPGHVWNGYGGLPVAVAQYTSTGRVAGYGGPVDQNVFRGTRAELAALLGLSAGGVGGGGVGEENQVSWTQHITVAAPGDRAYKEVAEAAQFVGDTYFWVADMYKTFPAILAQILAATNDDLTADQILERVDTAVREQTERTMRDTVMPVLRASTMEAVSEALGDEHVALAEAVAENVVNKTGARLLRPLS